MDAYGSSTQTAGLGDYVGWLLRRWWIVVLTTIIGAIAALGYASTQPKAYDSTTPVLVLAPYNDGTKVDLDTEAQVVTSSPVADAARAALKTSLNSVELASQVTVTVPPNTSVLDITFEAATPTDAQAGSQAFATAYLTQRQTTYANNLQAQKSTLSDQLSSISKQINTLAARVASLPPNSVDGSTAQQQLQLFRSQYAAINNRLAPLQGTVVKAGNILSNATLPGRPAKPNRILYLASGIVAGLLIGLAIALGLARLDTRLYRASDVPERPDVPVLMKIAPGRQRPAVADAATALGRDFSVLRNELRFAASAARGGRPSPTDSLLICGAVAGPATGFVAANLAAAFGRSGERVIIVCTDPESGIPELLGVAPTVGLGEVLSGEVKIANAIQAASEVREVSVLATGKVDARFELPVGDIASLVQALQARCDRVLIATAPPNRSVEAQALSEVVASVLLVVETRRAHIPDVDAALDQFARVHAPVAGMLVVSDQWKGVKPAARPGPPIPRPAVPRVPPPSRNQAPSAKPPVMPVNASSSHATSSVEADASDGAEPGTVVMDMVGWRGRNSNADQTLILPKAVDVDDPKMDDWSGPHNGKPAPYADKKTEK
jgi:succinoglycan biosynthesis transport protein ExoP